MFVVVRLDFHKLCPQLRVLRAVHDEDVATEYAYQHALDQFDSSDNIDVVDGSNLAMDVPEFVTGFTAYRSQETVFGVIGVVHKRKASGTLF